jgi:ankyrin repeat protein
VEHLLKTLPTTLDETYARMLERIGPAERGDALTLLRWLAYSMRPVTLAELQTAVIVRPEDDEVDIGDEGGLGDSLNILSGLVVFSECVIDSSTKEDGDPSQHGMTAEVDNLTPGTLIRLAHFSVKEYLESTRIFGSSVSFFGLKSGVCHRFLSQSCLTYLMHYSSVREEDRYRRKTESQLKREFAGPPSYRWHDKDQDIENFPLLDYTASQWYRHSQWQSGDDINREVALLTCEKAKSAWRWIYARHSSADRGSVPSVYDAVELNLPHVAEKLLKAGEDVNATGPGNVSLLVAATRNEDEAMVKLLIAHGADVNMFSTLTGYTSEIALFSAAFKELPLTQLLVDHGADVNLVCGHGTALSAASKCGNQPVVKFLLEKGALVDLVDGSRRTALIEASSNKCNEVVELLIAKGADVNSPNTHITPLIAAARSGNADGVAILINAGADINAQNSGALLDAILGGHAQTAALLETRGAKSLTSEQLNDSFVRVCDERISRGRPYHYDPERAVVLLLERGADVNSHDSSALLAALEQGHENMVALLEAKGAKQLTLEQLNGALFKVCSRRQRHYPETPVRLLLDRGADAHLVDRWARPSWVRHGAS